MTISEICDIRIRRALTHLFNRTELIEKLMFNQYRPQNSYYSGGIYENPDQQYTKDLIEAIPRDDIDHIRRRQKDRLQAAAN